MKIILFAAALALLAQPAEAARKKSKPHKGYHTHVTQPRIACTPAGCIPVQRGCYPAPGRTFDGDPSGFDVMVCGGGSYTMYGHR
jgi:hypothetical protein